MKKITLFLLVLCTGALLKAQHCPFDNTGLLVVRVVDAQTGEPVRGVVPYIRIRPGDGPAMSKAARIYPFRDERTSFVRNPGQSDPDWLAEGYRFEKVRYSFAGDDFIRPVSMDLRGFDLEIGLMDAEGRDLGVTHAVQSEEIFDLHREIGGRWHEIYDLGETPPLDQAFENLIVIRI